MRFGGGRMKPYKRRFGDRYDGRRIRTISPFFKLVPYIMRTRTDAQNFFDERIDIGPAEAYLRSKKDANLRNFGLLAIAMAALVRTFSQKPGMNRFVAGHRIYARNEISISLAVKREMQVDSPDTTIKLVCDPADTVFDVARRLSELLERNKAASSVNGTDKTARFFSVCPGFLVDWAVSLLMFLDHIGKMPKAVNRVSPFHASVFITDLGSIGIQPIYHHIYNFGTVSVFVAFGAKRREKYLDSEGVSRQREYLDFKIVTDERIADGFYYASAFKLFRSLMLHPERLETPPEHVPEDLD